MGRWKDRRQAYYSRNGSFSRSYNAERAENRNRFPRTRAAAHLELSVAAFDAGCLAVGYEPTEWHHVGAYAAMIWYFDCDELADNPKFWEAAAAVYKSEKKRAAVLSYVARKHEELRQLRLEEFRAKLIARRDCTRYVVRHSSLARWQERCRRARISTYTPVGDLAAFAAAVAERDARQLAKDEAAARRANQVRQS